MSDGVGAAGLDRSRSVALQRSAQPRTGSSAGTGSDTDAGTGSDTGAVARPDPTDDATPDDAQPHDDDRLPDARQRDHDRLPDARQHDDDRLPDARQHDHDRLPDARPPGGPWAWLGPLLVAALAGAIRLLHLGRPGELVFDETFYVKQAYSLLRLGYEGVWGEGANERFAAGDFGALTTSPEYVVHPPLGKWLIVAGMAVLGPENAAGWRLGAALAGTLTVFLVARLARRLFASTALGCVAGLLLALDGLHIVGSRTGILDVFLGLFAVAAFGAVVADRQAARVRLARLVAHQPGAPPGRRRAGLGPGLGVRWWLVTAGVLCGLATGVKWSGVYVLAVLGVLTVIWDVTARRAAGVRSWLAGGLLRDGIGAFLSLVPVAALTYAATWARWFAEPRSYLRDWASRHPEQTRAWLPDVVDSWLYFHTVVWDFHTGLSASHGYAAAPLGWVAQWRPTVFYWRTFADGEAACGAERCAQAVTSLGNPALWWAGLVALGVVVVGGIRLRDWRAGTIAAGYAALWLPWFFFPDRTTFTFYAIALAPFVALAVTYALALLLRQRPGGRPPRPDPTASGPWVAVAVLVLVMAAAVFFYPVWTAETIAVDEWYRRVWLPGWT